MKKIVSALLINLLLMIISTLIGYFLNSFNMDDMFNDSYESRIIEKIKPPSNYPFLKDVGGVKDIKEKLISNIILPLFKYDKFFGKHKIPGLPPIRNTMLVGPPGTGKTLLVNAIANESKIPFIQMRLSDIEDKYFGESNKLIKALFKKARQIEPCIIFFDEIDGLIRKRTDFDQSCTYGMKTELLQQIDDIQKENIAVIIIACTNCSKSLDGAIRRRIPHILEVKLPELEERVDILSKHITDRKLCEDIATETPGLSGSDLNDLVQAMSTHRLTRKLLTNPSVLSVENPVLGPYIEEDWKKAIEDARIAKESIDNYN